MNVLLVSINSKYIHSSLAVWYLYESVQQSCSTNISVNILEATINQPPAEIAEKALRDQADIIAFSCYIWNISMVYSLIGSIKAALPSVRILLGGPEVSYLPRELIESNKNIDYIITGEGEVPFPLLLSALFEKADISGIPGLCYKDEENIRLNPPAPPYPDPPGPYSKEYLSALYGRIAYLETSRGCPFSCSFCLSGLSGAGVRFFSIDRAKQNIVFLANAGAQTVKLVDRTFNCNPGRAYDIFNFIIKNAGTLIPSGVCFHFEVAADLFDETTLALLSSAPPGLIQLEAGIQTFNADALSAVVRKTNILKLESNIRKIAAAGNIHLHTDLIAGLPHEDLLSFARSFDRAYALGAHMLQLGFLKMLKGSDLRRRAQDLGYIYSPRPPYEIIYSPWLSKDDLCRLSQTEYALNKFYNSGRFTLTLSYLLKATDMQPFVFFETLGKSLLFIPANKRRSLDDITRQAYKFFCALPGVDTAALRDCLVCDRIACNQNIPDFLKIPDPCFKKTLSYIRNTYFDKKRNLKIHAALLYTSGKHAVFAKGEQCPVTGRIPLFYF
jgi:radical SAM superfamily enzyme YgiQ (UPF0313 family)